MPRLATFNVLHGRSLADGQVSTERLVEACASLEADVLCLQEIDRGQSRSGGVDQTRAVAEHVGAAAWRFEPALIGEPGGVWRPAADEDSALTVTEDAGKGQGGYGVGIVSKLPVKAWHTVRLRAAKVKAPVAVPGGRGRFILLPDEPRVGLVAELDGLGGLAVATTHLSFVPGYNLFQLRRLTTALEAFSPCMLLGDLNMPSPFPRWTSGWRSMAEARTYPAGGPRLQVDHVLAHGDVPDVRSVEVRHLPVSDHLALIVQMAERI